ncbi:GxxExxY protein [Larkinella humicola]|uniref:GxxExxY protein n=1 Tax=Larkinella humicola TaxID=2607654 RepID=A0A5N1J7F8_9BACT|nr:GxxExxY protein [Larkinella humicola]KAA9347120.1 GxxExxY protein [Larkinella humicola]
MEDSKLSYQIIKGAIEVHRALGPGLLESAYQECLQYELSEYGLYVEREKPMLIVYKEVRLNHGYRMDLLVEGRIVVETKTVETLTDVHFAQLLTYLKLGQFRLGLLINFHVTLLKEGISRVINPELRNSA